MNAFMSCRRVMPKNRDFQVKQVGGLVGGLPSLYWIRYLLFDIVKTSKNLEYCGFQSLPYKSSPLHLSFALSLFLRA